MISCSCHYHKGPSCRSCGGHWQTLSSTYRKSLPNFIIDLSEVTTKLYHRPTGSHWQQKLTSTHRKSLTNLSSWHNIEQVKWFHVHAIITRDRHVEVAFTFNYVIGAYHPVLVLRKCTRYNFMSQSEILHRFRVFL
jgi:hypothetical protein